MIFFRGGFVGSFVSVLLLVNTGCSHKAKTNAESSAPKTVSESATLAATPAPTSKSNGNFKVNSASGYQGLGVESVPTQELKNFAPPPLPSEVASKINLMLDIQTPGAGMLHPKKKQLFFSWRISGNSQIWKIDAPRSFPVQLTGGRDATSLMAITPDGNTLILQRDIDGQENPGIYLQSSDGGPLKKVFHQPKVRAAFQWIDDDSQWLYFSANDQTPESMAIYRYSLRTGEKETLLSEKGLWQIADHKKGQFLLSKQTGSLTTEIYYFELASKKLTPVLGQQKPEEYMAAFASQDDSLLVLTPEIGNFRRLYLFKNGKMKPITPEIKFDVSNFSIDDSRLRILYEVNEGGYTRLHAMDAKTFKPISIPKFPEADHVMMGTTTRNGKSTMISVISSRAPRISYSLDWGTGKLTQWTLPSVPEINLSKFVPTSLESYTTRDGVKIPMFVRRPPQCKDQVCPVIVHFHGGPEGQSTAGFHTLSQLFIDEGFIFVEPNVRGSDGYGKDWINLDNGPKRMSVITDIEDCAKEIRKNWARGGVVPKVGVMGWSYGGYSTLMAMTKFSGAYDSGVALVGMSHLLTFLNNTAPYRRKLRATEYGDPETDREALIQLSPQTYVQQVKSPLMIIQGANDPRVPVGEAIQIHKTLQNKNIKSSLIIFPDEGHGAQKKENRILEWGHTLNFFMQTLK